MKDRLFLAIIYLFIANAKCLIVPEEIPSILSIIYSNIPPIKKGTDSRVGFGFRLGEHADAQVIIELGPQTETKPIGGSSSSSRKRQALKRSEILQLMEIINKQKQTQPSKVSQPENISDTPGGKWLNEWSKKYGKRNNENPPLIFTPEREPEIDGIGEISAAAVIPDDNVAELNNLYKKNRQAKQKKSNFNSQLLSKLVQEKDNSLKESSKENIDSSEISTATIIEAKNIKNSSDILIETTTKSLEVNKTNTSTT